MPATASPTGELPLSLAACTNQPELVDLLLGASASVVEQDSHGNTVLHALVMVADDDSQDNSRFITAMYDHILLATAKVHSDWRLESIHNKEGLTPLKLAAKRGKVEVKRINTFIANIIWVQKLYNAGIVRTEKFLCYLVL